MKDLFSNNNIQPAESPSVGGNSAAKDKLETLRKQLHEHNYNYYVLSQPTISDIDFDALMQQLAELERSILSLRSPIRPRAVGSDIKQNFVQVQLDIELSLQNTYTERRLPIFQSCKALTETRDFEIV